MPRQVWSTLTVIQSTTIGGGRCWEMAVNILHFLNVLIGFSLVMLLLSIVTSTAAQAILVALRVRSRLVGRGLSGLLEDLGFDPEVARVQVSGLLTPRLPGAGHASPWSGLLDKLLPGAPADISREELVMLLMRQARSDDTVAKTLGLGTTQLVNEMQAKLDQAILAAEVADSAQPAQVWRTRAMHAEVPVLASRVFARFDEVMDRVTDQFSFRGKLLGSVITLPLLLFFWPVDSIDLFNRLRADQALSARFADQAQGHAESLRVARDKLEQCRTATSADPSRVNDCTVEAQALETLAADELGSLMTDLELFGRRSEQVCAFSLQNLDVRRCEMAELTPGLLITWILVSLGSAFWLALLDKILGIRSELTRKTQAQRDFRAASQVADVKQ